jgi:Ca2+-binding RTX toxin-like protein
MVVMDLISLLVIGKSTLLGRCLLFLLVVLCLVHSGTYFANSSQRILSHECVTISQMAPHMVYTYNDTLIGGDNDDFIIGGHGDDIIRSASIHILLRLPSL